MAVTKITYRECDCWSLPYGIRKKIRGHETLNTFTKKIGDKTNQNKINI